MAPNPTGTIEVVTPNPTLGQLLQLRTAWEGRISNPRVECNAYQNGEQVFGQTTGPGDHFRGNEYLADFDPFGANPVWDAAGPPAQCKASLFYFDQVKGQQTRVDVASVEFDAAV